MLTKNDTKINICYLVSKLSRNGPIFQLYNIIKHLDRTKFHPRIIVLCHDVANSLADRFREMDVGCDFLDLSRMMSMVVGGRKIKSLLRKNPVDLIHASDYRTTLLCAVNSFGIPRVITCRGAFDHTHHTLSGEFGPILSRVLVKAYSAACKRSERVVAVSNHVRNSAEDGLINKIEVIYNGVDQDIFRPVDQIEKKRLRSKLGLPLNKQIFVSVGILCQRKDPETVIKGFLESQASRNGMLILLGDGPLREQCDHMAAARDNVRIAGFVENIKDYLGAADILVSASINEGYPNAIIEALACGLPVILSDIPPHREILVFNEQAGTKFSCGNVMTLSKIFTKFEDIDYSLQSQAALDIIDDHLNAKNMSSKYQQLYSLLCHKQS